MEKQLIAKILIFSFCYFLKQIVTDGADLSAKARKGKINGTEVAPFREFSMVMVVSMMMMMTMMTMVIVMITGPKVDRVCVVQSNSVCAQWTPIIASLHHRYHHHCFTSSSPLLHHHHHHHHCFTSSSLS